MLSAQALGVGMKKTIVCVKAGLIVLFYNECLKAKFKGSWLEDLRKESKKRYLLPGGSSETRIRQL